MTIGCGTGRSLPHVTSRDERKESRAGKSEKNTSRGFLVIVHSKYSSNTAINEEKIESTRRGEWGELGGKTWGQSG